MGLHHQIADGEHRAVAVDDNAGAFARAAEILRRPRIGIDEGLAADDRGRPVPAAPWVAPARGRRGAQARRQSAVVAKGPIPWRKITTNARGIDSL